MTARPTRITTDGRAYLDLQNKARRDRRPTDELLQLYALEGFLSRLATSEHATVFVLKGGVLLTAYDTRRPTRDVDLQAAALANDVEAIRAVIADIAGLAMDDGLVFDATGASAAVIREEGIYPGVRVSITAQLATARLSFHVDVNVGDPIEPGPEEVRLPRLLGGEIVVQGYPLPMVIAEKLVTAVARGTANTRWRDFYDLWHLSRHYPIHGDELHAALVRVGDFRGVGLRLFTGALVGYAELGQGRWQTWCRRQRLDDHAPRQFAEVLDEVGAFADPALQGGVNGRAWEPEAGRWQ